MSHIINFYIFFKNKMKEPKLNVIKPNIHETTQKISIDFYRISFSIFKEGLCMTIGDMNKKIILLEQEMIILLWNKVPENFALPRLFGYKSISI